MAPLRVNLVVAASQMAAAPPAQDQFMVTGMGRLPSLISPGPGGTSSPGLGCQ